MEGSSPLLPPVSGENSKANHKQDVWTFSLRLPAGCEGTAAAAATAAAATTINNRGAVAAVTSTDDGGPQWIELSQSQEPPPPRPPPIPAATTYETQHTNDENGNDERVSLLDEEEKQAGDSQKKKKALSSSLSPLDRNNLSLSTTGWTLSSPYWSLTSQLLLQVTYCVAWQNLPEYTNCRACAVGGWSRIWQCSCNCRCATDRVDYYSTTYTTHDILQVEHVPSMAVPGVDGYCQAIKLYLKPLDVSHVSATVPPHLQAAWHKHCQNMRSNTADSRHDNDPPAAPVGPVITFALSDAVDAPLLWHVSLPPPTTAIAVDSIAVLDGRVRNDRRKDDKKTTAATSTATTSTEPVNSVTDTKQQHCWPDPTHLYINGWQSWSFGGSVAKGRDQPRTALPPVLSGAFLMGGTPPPAASTMVTRLRGKYNDQITLALEPFRNEKYKSDFFTCFTSDTPEPRWWKTTQQERSFPYQQLDERGGPALVLGWLSQRQQFGIIRADKHLQRVHMNASCHGQVVGANVNATKGITTDWAYAQLVAPHSYDEEPMAQFLHTVARVNRALPLRNGNLLTGWCSWYHYYENITAQNLRENFAKLTAMRTKVPTNVAVVDDGYMTAWGDWNSLKAGKFDEGMDRVARDIGSHNMRAGVWLAPFACDKLSKIALQHRDWILHNDAGVPANSSNCGKFFYGLDATNPAVRAHAHRAVQRAVEDWQFSVLKLDFLYAACLMGNGRHDLSMSRAQAMDLAIRTIRDAAGPNTFIIGCGCPIASAIGYFDAMRVSADTGPTWYPPLPMPPWDQGTLPCLRSMIRNSISRAPMGHRWWHNDPDCLLLGESTRLTDIEVASAASIVAMTCGMMLLSDDLTKVSLSRMRILTKIFPMTGVSAVVLDLHNTNDGLPSILRLWCTDSFGTLDSFRASTPLEKMVDRDHNAEATYFARQASFSPDEPLAPASERVRSCIHVTRGLGTWTIVSISNWSDGPAVVYVPPMALSPPPVMGNGKRAGERHRYGYHVFGFWSSKYTWLPHYGKDSEEGPEQTVSKRLAAHETEIFHVKPVTPEWPQFIGSDLHFSCGHEVRTFVATKSSMDIRLKTDLNRIGHIFVFIPRVNTDNVKVVVNGETGRWVTIGNTPKVAENGSPRLVGRVLRIMLVVHANGMDEDGHVEIEF